MTTTCEQELRSALAHLREARQELPTANTVETRDVIRRELGYAELNIGRALHLLAGVAHPSPRIEP